MKKFSHLIAAIAKRFGRAIRILGPWLQSSAPGPARTPALNQVLLNLCGGDKELAEYVLGWLALQLRRPGTKMPNALCFEAGQGTGKSLYFERVVLPLFGAHGAVARELSSTFNPWLRDARLVVVDNNEPSESDLVKLKHLITNDSIHVHQKAVAPSRIRNRINFICFSGAYDVFPADEGNRRFTVIKGGSALPAEIYAAAADEIRNGAIYALGHYLRSHTAPGRAMPRSMRAEHGAAPARVTKCMRA